MLSAAQRDQLHRHVEAVAIALFVQHLEGLAGWPDTLPRQVQRIGLSVIAQVETEQRLDPGTVNAFGEQLGGTLLRQPLQVRLNHRVGKIIQHTGQGMRQLA